MKWINSPPFLDMTSVSTEEFYQLPGSTLQLAKVSKLLITMEKEKLSDLQQKGLDDIEINSDDEI